jgi:hypothetical protein
MSHAVAMLPIDLISVSNFRAVNVVTGQLMGNDNCERIAEGRSATFFSSR